MIDNGSTLMVIGNGFDVQCGLKSRYEDFFEWLRKDESKALALNNLWAHYFLNQPPKEPNWDDIEAHVARFLCEPSYQSPKFLLEMDAQIIVKANLPDSIKKGSEASYIHYYSQNRRPPGIYWYLEELNKFESMFGEYLKSEVENNDSYLPNATKLMNMLIEDNEELDIITFNYTNPFESIGFDKAIGKVTHVHGTYAEDNIIFGVDATAKLQNNAHIFTKTHRKMLQKSPSRALPKNVHTIKLYGHSLGDADYSYFHSMFDNYNLYGSDVELKFYFSIYDESKKTEIERSASDRVYRLINVYGTTLDNKDKGKNLLHKLLLEGRLKIEFLDDLEKTIVETM